MKKTYLLIISIILLACPQIILANEFKYTLTPSIKAKEMYDSKVGHKEDGDFRHSVTPAISLDAENPKSKINCKASVSFSKYNKESKYDGADQSYNLNFSTQATQRLNWGIGASLKLDNTSDYALTDVGTVVAPNDRIVYSVSPSLNYVLTPKTDLGANYAFRQTAYDKNDLNSDNYGHNFGLTLNHQLSEKLSVNVSGSAGYSYYKNEDGRVEQSTYNQSVGTSYLLRERVTVALHLGLLESYKHSTRPNDNSGWATTVSGGASLTWSGEKWNLSGSYSRGHVEGIDSENLLRDQISCIFSYTFTQRLKAFLEAGYTHSQNLNPSSDDQENNYYNLGTGLSYVLTENANLDLGYAYDHSDDGGARYKVYLGIGISFPQEL
jgi:hypothetical protein